MEPVEFAQTHYTNESKWPSSLKRAADVAETLGIPLARVQELTDALFMPHWRIDGGEPMYNMREVKDWAGEHLLQRIAGHPLPVTMRVMIDPPPAVDAPATIREIPNLRQVPIAEYPPGVYFLVRRNKVVYVGQSINPMARVYTHKGEKEFETAYMIPVPSSELDYIEGAIIRLMKPYYNGGVQRPATGPGDKERDEEILQHYGVIA